MAGDLVPIIRRMVQWDPATGAPVLSPGVPMLAKNQLADMVVAAISQPYHDPSNAEPEFEGMTNAEVMLIKLTRHAAATGDKDLIESLLDRILGKPKTTAETRSVSMTYEQLLEQMKDDPGSPPPPVDVTPEYPPPDPLGELL